MILNGAGDPRTITPIPDGTNDKLYVDDLTGAVYSAVGFPPTWTPVTPPLVGSFDATGQSANVASTTLFTPTVTGMYEVGCYAVVTQAATTSSTLPLCRLSWTDPDTNAAINTVSITASNTGNTVGTNNLGSANSRVVRAKAGTAVTFDTGASYASSGATPMLYAIHVVVTVVK